MSNEEMGTVNFVKEFVPRILTPEETRIIGNAVAPFDHPDGFGRLGEVTRRGDARLEMNKENFQRLQELVNDSRFMGQVKELANLLKLVAIIPSEKLPVVEVKDNGSEGDEPSEPKK
jgi:hypothetical protein